MRRTAKTVGDLGPCSVDDDLPLVLERDSFSCSLSQSMYCSLFLTTGPCAN